MTVEQEAGMKEWNSKVEAVARADAAFAGRDFDGLSRVDRRRYLDRAAFLLNVAMEESFGGLDHVKERLREFLAEGRSQP